MEQQAQEQWVRSGGSGASPRQREPPNLTAPLGVFGETKRAKSLLSPVGDAFGDKVDVTAIVKESARGKPVKRTPKAAPGPSVKNPPPRPPGPPAQQLYGLYAWSSLGFTTRQGSLPMPCGALLSRLTVSFSF